MDNDGRDHEDREDVLYAEDAWLMRLDLDSLSPREVAEIKRYYRLLPPPRDLEETRAALKRVRGCKDIVHDWDDEHDFSLWKSAFKRLKS